MDNAHEVARLRERIRRWMLVFIVGLVLSGVTAFPLVPEVNFLAFLLGASGEPASLTGLAKWIATVHQALQETEQRFPFLFYGTDWLAFGHLVIALFFVGPYRDPVRNVFIVRVGVVACAMVWPLAFICGAVRGIPFYWQLIDCSFGVFGMIPLLLTLRDIRRLEALSSWFPVNR